MHCPVIPFLNVGTGSVECDQISNNVPNSIQTDSFDATEQEETNTDDIVEEPKSQIVNPTQVSSQTFMAEMEKRFSFYKCEKITINFQPTILQKK